MATVAFCREIMSSSVVEKKERNENQGSLRACSDSLADKKKTPLHPRNSFPSSAAPASPSPQVNLSSGEGNC